MRRIPILSAVIGLTLLSAGGARAQQPAPADSTAADTARAAALDEAARDSVEREENSESDLRHAAVFFAKREPLELTLTTNLRELRHQKGDENPYRDAVLAYRDENGRPVRLAAGVRTRGIFRLKMCDFPPVRLRLRRSDRTGTVLEGLRRPKLVTYCKDRDEYEQYVLQEYLAYRIYEQLTPLSLRTRLVRITYVDSASGRPETTRYGIVLEEEEALAARHDAQILDAQGARPHHLDPYQATLFAVFEYLIGNTDWSIPVLHNVFLLQTVQTIFPVAYDFDFSGVVKARYAAPDPKLGITQVTQRIYRGSCATVDEIPAVLEHVRSQREAILAIVNEPIGLDARNAKRVRDFVGDFFEELERPERVRSTMAARCVPVR